MGLKSLQQKDFNRVFSALDTETLTIGSQSFQALLPAPSPFADPSANVHTFEQTKVPAYFEIPANSSATILSALTAGRNARVAHATWLASIHRWTLSNDPLLLRFYLKEVQQ